MKTKLQKKKNDARELFWRLVVRKPERYADIPLRRCLDGEQVEALQRLPVIDLGRPDTCGNFDKDMPMEFVGLVGGFGLSYFYINTEGYDYPRYAFRLPARPQDLQQGITARPDDVKVFADVVKATLKEEKNRLSPRAAKALEVALLQIGAL